jgi:hypothetical protein
VRHLLLAAALAASARAGVLSFDAGPADGTIFSGDGYHVARLESDAREDHWVVDGAVRARGRTGSFPAAGVLSQDGSKLLHLIEVRNEKGDPAGVAAALNGRRLGKPFPEIQMLTLSPSGRNAGYVAKTKEGWAVISGQGVGPAFPDPPGVLTLTDSGTLYFAVWQGTVWLYKNHKPVKSFATTDVSASPDLKHVGALVRDTGKVFVEVDGKRYGPYANATTPVFSRGGGHWAAMASHPGAGDAFDVLLADGRPAAGAACSGCSVVVDDAGRAFQDLLLVSISDRGQMHSFYLNGKELREGGRPPKIGMLAGGGHFVYPMLTPRGVGVGFDGRVLEYDVPLPLPDAPVEFDGPGEYHYWSLEGQNLRLVCGTDDGSEPKLSRCAQWAGRIYAPAP